MSPYAAQDFTDVMKDLGVQRHLPLSRQILNAVAWILVGGRQKEPLQVRRRGRGPVATEAELERGGHEPGTRRSPPCTPGPRRPPRWPATLRRGHGATRAASPQAP